jgi:flagellar protein FlaG
MDAGLTIKPVTGVAITDYARPAATVGTAATDLPTEQTVTPASSPTPTANNTPQPGSSSSDYDTRSITIDPQTREVIYRVIDSRTKQVITQVPDQTLLRNRAYSRAIANGSSPFEAQAQADLEV